MRRTSKVAPRARAESYRTVPNPPFQVKFGGASPPRAFAAGDPVFVLDKGGWFIGSAVVRVPLDPVAGRVRIQYMVPTNVGALFGSSWEQFYATSMIGIAEDADAHTVVPAAELELDPPAAGAPYPAGTVVVMLRQEPFRVQLAQLEIPSFLQGPGPGVVPIRMFAPDMSASTLAPIGAVVTAPVGTFVAVDVFAQAVQASFAPDQRLYLA